MLPRSDLLGNLLVNCDSQLRKFNMNVPNHILQLACFAVMTVLVASVIWDTVATHRIIVKLNVYRSLNGFLSDILFLKIKKICCIKNMLSVNSPLIYRLVWDFWKIIEEERSSLLVKMGECNWYRRLFIEGYIGTSFH